MTSITTKYDSNAEEAAAPIFARYHYYKTDDTLPFNCYDYNNIQHYGKGDFICKLPGNWPIVEFKAAPLNTIRTKEASEKAKARAEQDRTNGFSQASDRLVQLETGYNHSVYKIAECQAKAPPLGYITVFKDDPTLAEAELYRKHGLVYCTLDSFGMFLSFLMAVKNKGLPISYNQFTKDGQEVRLHLASIYKHQLEAQSKRNPKKPAKDLKFELHVIQGASLEEAPKGYKGKTCTLPKENTKAGKAFWPLLAKIQASITHA